MKSIHIKTIIMVMFIIVNANILGCSQERKKESPFEQAIDKVWIVSEVEASAWNTPCSFVIESIEDGKIMGRYATKTIATKDFYFYTFNSNEYMGSLKGTASGNVAECEFRDSAGNEGHITLSFLENGNIKGNVIYEKKSEADKNYKIDGVYIFKAYNLSDLSEIKPECEKKYGINLNSWGDIFLVTEQLDLEDKTLPQAFLVNDENDILYEFSAPFKVGTEATHVQFEDVNEDGLTDVKMYTSFIGDEEEFEWVFIQNEDGTFYSRHLEEDGVRLFE